MSNVKYTMLWDEFLIGRFLLPAIHTHFELSFEPIDEPDDIVIAIKVGVPRYAVDDVYKIGQYSILFDLPMVYYTWDQIMIVMALSSGSLSCWGKGLPPAGRSRFSPDRGSGDGVRCSSDFVGRGGLVDPNRN
jgi:hypothetical protein